ncbi:MAG: hypothetical protein HOH86_07470 [Verrucomicrobiales bacterium]|nr:hypothetical protein [Verrucomicrobiales bacterium]
MNTARHFTLLTLLLALSALSAAKPDVTPTTPTVDALAAKEAAQKLAEQLTPSLPPMRIGIPTPMEEYGLSIGDITVTRVHNPLGQLTLNKHLLLSRRLNRVTNPWEELSPGTAIEVDGRKAVIVEIEPATAPKDLGGANLLVTIRAKEIGGPEMSLTWQQELQTLNDRVEAEERRRIVGRVKRELRVGSHLIIEGNRAILTALTLTTQAGAAREANPPTTLHARYSGISSPHGELTGQENRAESQSEPTWHFQYKPASGGANSNPQNMADSSIRMVTWSFVRRTIAGKPGPDGVNPSVTIIHRRRGLVTRIEAPVDDPYVARIEAQFSFEGRVLTRTFDWNLSRNASRKVLWELRPHPSETYVLIYAVNDPNVRFQVTPRSLIEANEKAMASLQSMRNPNAARSALGHIPNFTTNTVENQLLKLQKISDGDASAVIKGEAKRQAVIVLAQRYERQAIHNKALANEQRLRAKMELATARHLELNAWVNLQKASLLRGQLPTADLAGLERGANLVRPNDLELTLNTIAEADRDVAKYQQATTGKSLSDKAQDYAQFFRRAQVQGNRADELRADAKKRLASTYASDAKVTEYYLRSLKMWKEYILRTEGLQKEERGLFERGLVKSPLPPDPLIPEILLRQGWIYRELGLPDEAVDTFFGVLASSIRQEVDNLVRFNRISLVAQSQIANAYYEAPQKLEDYKLAVEKLEIIMMQPAGERAEDHELDLEQIQLRYMRALYKAIRAIDSRLTRDNRRIKFLKNGTLASDKLLSQITVLAKDRNEHWRSLAKQSALFIEQYTKTQSSQSVRYDGEVRYYKILAHQALGNEQHVQREVEELLQNSSVTSELEAVWANTRLQIVMDIANLLYAEAIQLQGDVEHLGQLSGEATPVLGAANTLIRPRLQDSVQAHLTAAITYYTWAQKRDQSYRSQIFLRQQLAFCHERLGQKSKALNYYNQLLRLLKLHPSDLTPALMLVKNTTVFRQKNLQTEIEQLNKIN